jgi:uncharacterized protein YjeT (DUF2065 family)
MDLEHLLQGLGWVLIIEGLLPLIAPGRWRQMMTEIFRHQDGQLRFFGLFCIALGLILLMIF